MSNWALNFTLDGDALADDEGFLGDEDGHLGAFTFYDAVFWR
jgi:hypothetical protein